MKRYLAILSVFSLLLMLQAPVWAASKTVHLGILAIRPKAQMQQDRAVKAVLEGGADMGFVRTGLIEQLERQSSIPPGSLKIINRRDLPGFPFAGSTRRPPFYAAPPFSIYDVWKRYRPWIICLALAVAIGIQRHFRQMASKRRLKEALNVLEQNQRELTEATTAKEAANRAQRLLSASNRALLRMRDEEEQLFQVCNIAVQLGGYSSLSYLTDFPISIIKTDMAFVRDITTDKRKSRPRFIRVTKRQQDDPMRTP